MRARISGWMLLLLGSLGGIMALSEPFVAASAASMTVYVVDGLTRVRPGDPPRPTRVAEIQAARNEYEPFQIVVRAGDSGLKGVNVAVSDLRGKGGTPSSGVETLLAAKTAAAGGPFATSQKRRRAPSGHGDPFRAGGHVIPHRDLTLFREHYVQVTRPSPRSKEGAGWYPDALIPFLNPINGKPIQRARFLAAPFDVAPNANQPVWVDVFVPKTAAPGRYTGTVTVTAQDHQPVGVPVKLTVWDFALPDTPSLRSNFGGLGERVAAAHKERANARDFIAIERRYAEALAAHRLCPPIPSYLRPKVNPDGSIDPAETHAALKAWIKRFHVTGFPLSLLGSDPLGKDRERSVRYLQAMYAYLKANGWEKYAYIYVLDEPNDAAAYEQVRQRAKLIHEAQPGIKVLCTEQPTPQDPAWGTLVGSVDIWVPLWPLLEEKDWAARHVAGEEFWSYTALCQGKEETPFWELDFPLLNYRIPLWTSWRYGMTGLLYWTTVYWEKAGDVWTNPLTYNRFNGEGSLFYPGADAGFDGPVASMRLKQIREGIEDYEYLQLLADRGDRRLADGLAMRLARSWTQWDTDPAHLYATRARIAQRITTGR